MLQTLYLSNYITSQFCYQLRESFVRLVMAATLFNCAH